jgi:hypothetical protein
VINGSAEDRAAVVGQAAGEVVSWLYGVGEAKAGLKAASVADDAVRLADDAARLADAAARLADDAAKLADDAAGLADDAGKLADDVGGSGVNIEGPKTPEKVPQVADEVAEAAGKPSQDHHYMTNKSKTYTKQFEDIVKKYGLDLDESWNKDLLPHQGRHPNAYHDCLRGG